MPRNVTLDFDDGSSHVYQNVPDTVTPDQITQRASTEFTGKAIKNIDGGNTAAPVAAPKPSAESVVKNRIQDPFASVGKNAYDIGGKATDLASKIGLPPKIAGGVGYITNVALQAIPT